jgi:aminoacyl tRNA synthase complex-interacting multifunctional protein 1
LSLIDIRVGKILSVEKHPESDKLYIEKIDLGEEAPRQVLSGLAEKLPMDALLNKSVIVCCNMKPLNLRGVTSHGMLLCAERDGKVEIVAPPVDSLVGARLTVDGLNYSALPPVFDGRKKDGEKILKTLEDLRTDEYCIVRYKGTELKTPQGPCRVESLSNASVH